MNQWSNENPGAGSAAGSASSISALSSVGRTLDDVYTRSVAAVSAVSVDVWSGYAAEAWRMKARGVLRVIPDVKDAYDSVSSAVARYQSAVDSIRGQAEPLRSELEYAQSRLHSLAQLRAPWDVEGIAEDAIAMAQMLQTRRACTQGLVRLGRERRAADDALVGLLRSSLSSVGSAHAGRLSGANRAPSINLMTEASLGKLSDRELLALLSGLTAGELAALLKAQPGLADRIAAQDPATIRDWWASYNEQNPNVGDPMALTAQQRSILSAIPSVVGNLNGIPYTHRDIANRLAHADSLADLQRIQDESHRILAEKGAGAFDSYLTGRGHDSHTLQTAINTGMSIGEALKDAEGLTYQFVQYQQGPPVLAAISIGNMDTASQVTVNVPGMDATVRGSMAGWTAAARNLYDQQSRLNRLYGDEVGLAVVSWIGYETPTVADVIQSDRAVTGAVKLTDFLQGITGTRDWGPGQNLSVVAHSYGTTVATLAVVGTPVESLTLLASAGLDNSITNVNDLMVNRENVWASEAEGDRVADLGRGDLPVHYNRSTGEVVYLRDAEALWEHSVDPTRASFGGNTFSSEGVGDMRGSDGHDAHPQVDADRSGTTTDKFGYFDRLTTPIFNSGVSSLGLDLSLMVAR